MKNVYNLRSLSPDKCVNLFFIDSKMVNTF